jgi:hypothetical protein
VSLDAALERLSAALEDERAALIALDGDALRAAGERKLAALDEVGTEAASQPDRPGLRARLRSAYEQHQGNAALLMRRRQETTWLLQSLGAISPASAYDANGGRVDAALPRRIAEA